MSSILMEEDKAKAKKLSVDYIHFEATSDTIEIHRGRNGYEWSGQKGKICEWTLPILVEKDADEILEQIYNCKEWEPYGKGRETSKDTPGLRDRIWQIVLPHIDIRSLKPVPKIGEQEFEGCKRSDRASMNRAQNQGSYVDKDRIKQPKVVGSDECYTFYQGVELVADWFVNNVDENYFRNKIVYCNCDDTKSAFWIYFYNNFHKLGLKKLIASAFDKTGLSYGNNYEEHMRGLYAKQEECGGYIYEYNGGDVKRFPPEGEKSTFHGDFKEPICYNIAKNEADIIMTNPPFGKKWRSFVETMLETGKKVIFWGNGGAPLYNWFMPLLNEKKVFIIRGCSDHYFTDHYLSPTYHRKRALAYIYTTEDLSFQKPGEKHYSTKKKMLENDTAWYDDDGVLCCDNAMIPKDTDEILAVSINVLKHNILNDGYEIVDYHGHFPYKSGKKYFWRIKIQKESKRKANLSGKKKS